MMNEIYETIPLYILCSLLDIPELINLALCSKYLKKEIFLKARPLITIENNKNDVNLNDILRVFSAPKIYYYFEADSRREKYRFLINIKKIRNLLIELKLRNYRNITNLTDKQFLTFLPNLETLEILNCYIDINSLEHLTKLKKLEITGFQHCVQDKILDSFSKFNLPDLTSLSIGNCPNFTDFGLMQMTNLVDLRIKDVPITNISIIKLTNLTSLDIGPGTGITDEICSSLKHIINLSIHGSQNGITDVGLSKMHWIKKLELSDCDITHIGLKNKPNCKILSISSMKQINFSINQQNSAIEELRLSINYFGGSICFESFINLRKLTLNFILGLNDDQFNKLSTTLTHLEISACDIKPELEEKIRQNKQFKFIKINNLNL